MTPQAFSDETLMAYADGELDAETARSVERAAALDAALAERIALFRATGAALREAGAARPAAPVPDALMSRVRATLEARDAGPEADGVVPLAARRAGGVPRGRSRAAMALAASLALAVGLAAGLALRPAAVPEPRPGLAALEAGGLAGALSRLAAGDVAEIPAGELSVIASFRAPDGTLCREFELAAEGKTTVAVACAETAAWDLRFAVAQGGGGAGGYAPAGTLDALDAWLAGIGAGAPLSEAEERAALSDLAE